MELFALVAMRKIWSALVIYALLLGAFPAFAQRQMEKLGRGIVAVRTGTSTAYVGWRLLGTDAENIGFNLLRSANGATPVQLNGALLTNSCNFTDSTINFAVSNAYFIQPVVGSVTQTLSAPFGLAANPVTQQYLNIALQKPADGTNASGPFTYSPNDCSAADLDGDGEYEIVLKWDPSNSKDNSQSGFTGNVFLDAYKLNGTLLWRIDLGPNIRAGAHYTQFMVYDLDGDGRAELACKTAPGTKDGLGAYVDGNASFTVYTNSNGYILSGPEYFTIFDGLTGAKLAHTNYVPARGTVSDWGDSYGNRVDRFLAGIAYLDGVRPSVVMCRGYYTRTTLAAWDWRNGVLTQRWLFDTGHSGGPYADYKEQGNHQLSVADVDADGRDEIIYGACTIDDDGTGLYTTGLRHGDALHVSDLDPARPGYERWGIHETDSTPGSALTATATGEILWLTDNADVGRGVAADLTAAFPGAEVWGGTSGLRSIDNQSAGGSPSSSNFAVWWDADLLRELEDGTSVTKYGGGTLLSASGAASNNSTKSTPNLSADFFGDWREEVIWRTSDNLNLRIYTTTTVATNRLVTLMHDPMYRVAIAWQNTAYNQPPHPGFYIGPGMFPAPVAPISAANLVWRGGGVNTWDTGTTANWVTNGVWAGANPAVTFAAGRSVLFDLTGSNQTAITLSGILTPAQVTVHAAKDYSFAGSGQLSGGMKLIKAGPAKLTLNTTNAFTGGVFVSGGALFINGAVSSAVTVERRGTPEGPSQFGGSGQLGGGLTVQAGCILTVGANTNSPGTLTVTNTFTELGGVLNQFDLSIDPNGITGSNDLLRIIGNVVLSGTNIITITQTSGFLGGGVYPLLTYTGTLTGGLTNLVLTGNFIQPVALTNPPGMIGLLAVVPSAAPTAPANLVAAVDGPFQVNLAWTDTSTNEAEFLLERSLNGVNFAALDSRPGNTTAYSDIGLTPDTTYYYRLRGTNLAGVSPYSNLASATTSTNAPALTWRGDGVNNFWDIATSANWRNGATPTLYGDTALVTFDDSGSNSPTIYMAATLLPGAVTFNATKNYTLGGTGALSGATSLLKAGSGTLTLSGNNSYAGGTLIAGGTVSLNTVGAASGGNITVSNGNLTLNSVGNPATIANNLIFSGPATLTTPSGNNNQATTGAWTGNGALAVNVASGGTYSPRGSMIGFNGSVTLGAAGTFRFYGSAGSSAAGFNLGTGAASLITRDGGTISLGSLSGGAGTLLRGASSSDVATTFLIGGNNANTTFAGTITNGNNALRSVALNKQGTGTLTLTGTNGSSGPTTVSTGKLLVNGNHIFATNTVTVNPTGTLGGTGIIGGNTTVNGTLAPGTSIGTLTFNGNLSFNPGSRAQFEISRNPFTNDQVTVLGTLARGGTLEVLNTSVELLEAGDNFQLFNAPNVSGNFAAYNLPALEEGLAWNTSQLATNGRLWVVSTNPPSITSYSLASSSFSFSGTGGTPNWGYDVLTSSDVALPLAAWTVVDSGQFDANGNFGVVLAVNPANTRQFFVVRAR
jgi:autotransporter-associated beta strand protein